MMLLYGNNSDSNGAAMASRYVASTPKVAMRWSKRLLA
jgi:hypothetical protein